MGIESIIQQNQLPSTDLRNKNIMGKDDFLRLMMLQMQHQDPLNPMDNEAMVSQMAQFSSLEQMSNLNSTLTNSSTLASFMEATSLLGKDVEVLDPSAPAGEASVLKTKVNSVQFTTDGPVLSLQNGMVAQVQDLIQVSEPAQQ